MSENTKNARQFPPLVISDVRIYPANGKGNILAYASIELNGIFTVHGLRVLQGNDGPFVSMPQRIVKDEYKDICHPNIRETRKEITDAVLDKYESWLERDESDGV